MKNNFLFILLALIILIFVYRYKEGLQNFNPPTFGPEKISSDYTIAAKDNPLFSKMVLIDTSANVMSDLKYFNNSTNLIYGHISSETPNV